MVWETERYFGGHQYVRLDEADAAVSAAAETEAYLEGQVADLRDIVKQVRPLLTFATRGYPLPNLERLHRALTEWEENDG